MIFRRKKEKSKSAKKTIEIDITWILLALIGIVVFAFIIFNARQSTYNIDKIGEIPLFVPSKIGDSAVVGDINKAKVIVFDYTDFGCAVCQRFMTDEFNKLEPLINEGKIAWVFKHFIAVESHKPVSEPAIVVSECVRKNYKEGYLQFVKNIYKSLYTRKIVTTPIDKYYEELVKLAQLPDEITPQVTQCVEKLSEDPYALYKEDQEYVIGRIAGAPLPAEYVETLGYGLNRRAKTMAELGLGTPLFVVCKNNIENKDPNGECEGYPILGYMKAEEMKQLIDKLLTEDSN